MIKAFFLIFEPSVAWDKIAQAKRGFVYITAVQLLPLLLLGALLEAWGLSQHGKWEPRFQMYKLFTRDAIVSFEVIQFILLLAMVFVTALLVYRINQSFQQRLTFLQSFTTIAYAFCPMFLVHFLDSGATVHPAVPWLIGLVLATWTLYQGIPRVMQPDPTHAFGVYLSSMIVVVLTSATARAITAMYLLGYMDFQHSWLSRKITHLFDH
jgi:hypothetical protein